MSLPRIFPRPELVLATSPRRWDLLFRRHGAALPTAPTHPLSFARSLYGLPVPAELADAIDLLALLATDVGGLALRDAARDMGRALPEVPVADLALSLLAARPRDPSIEPLLERARLRIARSLPEMPFELAAAEPRRAREIDGALAVLRELHGDAFVDAWAVEDDEGSFHFAVVRRARPTAVVVMREGSVSRRARRVVVDDVLRVEVAEGRLLVRTSDPPLVRAYADAIGRGLFGRGDFFTDAPAFTLKSLADAGPRALAERRDHRVSRVRVVACQWDDGRGANIEVRSSDALAAFDRLGGAAGGYVRGATFRLDTDAQAKPLEVSLRLPNRAGFRAGRHEPLVRRTLASLGVFAPGTIADDAWSLAPFDHPEWRWREVVGDDSFDALRDRGILSRIRTRRMATRATRAFGPAYVSFPLTSDPGASYAVPDDPALPSITVRDTDTEMWTLSIDRLREELARDLGLSMPDGGAEVMGGVFDLGVDRAARVPLHVFTALRSPGRDRDAVLTAVRRRARDAHPIVLVPHARSLGAGVVHVELSTADLLAARSIAARVLDGIADAMDLPELIPPHRRAAPDVRLVVAEDASAAWLDGTALTRVSPAGLRLLLALARANGAIVETRDVEAFLSPKRASEGAARTAAHKLAGWVRASFEDAGKEPPEDAAGLVVWIAGRGWKMGVRGQVV